MNGSFDSPPICGSLRTPAVHTAGGFTLVSAIFLMVVLVVLGTTMVTLSSVEHSTAAMRVQTLRAHYAARAGLEWAIERADASLGCTGNFTLDSITVAVSCATTAHTLNGVARAYTVATATATSGVYGGTDYVSRQLQAKVLAP